MPNYALRTDCFLLRSRISSLRNFNIEGRPPHITILIMNSDTCSSSQLVRNNNGRREAFVLRLQRIGQQFRTEESICRAVSGLEWYNVVCSAFPSQQSSSALLQSQPVQSSKKPCFRLGFGFFGSVHRNCLPAGARTNAQLGPALADIFGQGCSGRHGIHTVFQSRVCPVVHTM